MRSARRFILGVISLALARPCLAASAGAEPFDFLFLDANARPVALGGAYTALAADANALLYNPAGLAKVRLNEATFMHNQYLQGVTQEYAGFASAKGWGANVNYLSFGDVQRTTLSNPEGLGLGQATLTDLAFGAGYARAVTASLALGAGLKYIRETIDKTTAKCLAADVGGLYAVPVLRGLSLGIALQNLGPTARFQGAKENLPLNLRTGAAYVFKVRGHGNAISLDVTKERSQGALVAAGWESRVVEPLAVRLGFNTRNDAGLGISGGFGCFFRWGSIDYAFVPMGEMGNAHRISATLRWAAAPARAKAAPAPVAPEPPRPAEAAVAPSTAAAPATPAAQLPAPQPQEASAAVGPQPAGEAPTRVPLGIAFTPDESDISGADEEEVNKVAVILSSYPAARAVIEGHADNSGLEWWNQILSRSRAESIRDTLVQTFGIAAERLGIKGLGSAQPVAPNDTSEGRAKNRRVEAAIDYGAKPVAAPAAPVPPEPPEPPVPPEPTGPADNAPKPQQ